MDGIEGWVPALGPSGWQGGKVFSEVQRWNRIEADGQMKTLWEEPLTRIFPLADLNFWYNIWVLRRGGRRPESPRRTRFPAQSGMVMRLV